MTNRFDHFVRLEPSPDERNLNAGFAAEIHDPVWFLARQWQMGEHQGENASSPVAVSYTVRHTPIHPMKDVEPLDRFNPAITPAEAIVESEQDDWWTMGRRIRIGERMAQQANLHDRADLPVELRFSTPAPPYERMRGKFDGLALWNKRQKLHDDFGITLNFGSDSPPQEGPYTWSSSELFYQTTKPFECEEGKLTLNRHRGGHVDWYSADATPPADAPAGDPKQARIVYAAPLEYPGAPHSRWWEIEDADVDIGGYPPDTAHFSTMLLVDLIYSHSDDWFLFPVEGQSAQVVTLEELEVIDSFGRHYHENEWSGLKPPDKWSLFSTVGLRPQSLVLWLTAINPLESAPIENVQFGIDEYSNRLWAVERRIGGLDTTFADEGADPAMLLNNGTLNVNRDVAKQYAYIPSSGVVPYWHPYELDLDTRMFVQHGFANLAQKTPRPMPYPQAEVLLVHEDGIVKLHEVNPSTVPSNGIEIERRWQLARDVKGTPVLWLQRQRKSLRNPPARTVRFDVMEELSQG